MTSADSAASHRHSQPLFPWIVAAAFLLVYLITLNRWIAVESMPLVAKITGWDWAPMSTNPLYYLLTLPIRILPVGIQPVALNALSAVLGALTLAVLARSIQLLPHDRTRDQRERERGEFAMLSMKHAWLAPLAGAIFLGLQLNFWGQSTMASSEILDLLVFGYLIRCLLEFRVSDNQRWLLKLAFVYGLGVTNNWALVGYFPMFVAALIWILKIRFFNLILLLKLLVAGVLGLTLYLLLPAIIVAGGVVEVGFWEALMQNIQIQRSSLGYGFSRRFNIFVLGITSLLPIVFMGIRWPSSFGDISAAGNFLTRLAFRVVHLLFLAGAVTMALRTTHIAKAQTETGIMYFTFFYLAALVAGYCTGYVLLVFGRDPERKWRKSSGIMVPVNKLMVALVFLLAPAMAAGLIYRNHARIQANNAVELKQLADQMVADLPDENALILSDEPIRLRAFQSRLAVSGKTATIAPVETGRMESPDYQRHLHGAYPELWPELREEMVKDGAVRQDYLATTMRDVARETPVYYLHASFGYYFEYLYPRPVGTLRRLVPYQANEINPPALADETIESQSQLWNGLWDTTLEPLSAKVKRFEDNLNVLAPSYFFSKALNEWGVSLQRNDRIPEAGVQFERSYQLNTNNPVALVNLEFNRHMQSGTTNVFQPSERAQQLVAAARLPVVMLNQHGQFDEPNNCLAVGQAFGSLGNIRQAAQMLTRAFTLAPDNQAARATLARVFLRGRAPDKALEMIREIRTLTGGALPPAARIDLMSLEAQAWLTKGDKNRALEMLAEIETTFPDNPFMRDTLIANYMMFARIDADLLDQAERLAREQLAQTPNSVQTLMQLGNIEMSRLRYDDAVAAFGRILEINPDLQAARLNRAISLLQADRLNEAKADYEQLLEDEEKIWQAQYGAGFIAEKQGDSQAALEHYERYLEFAPPGTTEYAEVQSKVDALKD